jgi:hypothetical protein
MAILTEMYGHHIVVQRGRIVFHAEDRWLCESVLEVANIVEFRYSDDDKEYEFGTDDDSGVEYIQGKLYRDGKLYMPCSRFYRNCPYNTTVLAELADELNKHVMTHENYSIPWRKLLPNEASVHFDNRGFSLWVEDESNEDIEAPYVVRPLDVHFYDRDEAALWIHKFAVNAKGR